jgi:DnaK suppressor protein
VDARAAVEARRTEIRERLAAVEARLVDVRTARGDWTDEEHDPEGFALTFEWQQAEGARAQHEADLRELDLADARIEAGTYGTCAVCGSQIPAEQLELRPARLSCVACTT